MRKKLYGNYLGIVISGADKDPEYRGRCQIYFPGVSNTLYKKINKNLKDLSFGHIDPSVFTPDIIQDLRTVLPWSECAAPIAGGGTSAYHNEITGRTALGVGETINPDAQPPNNHVDPQPYASADVKERPDDIESVQNFQSIQGTPFLKTKYNSLSVNVDSSTNKSILQYSNTPIGDTSPILGDNGKVIGKIGSEYIGMVAPLKGSGSPLENLKNGELLNVTFTKNGKSYTVPNVAVSDRGPASNPSKGIGEFSYGTYNYLNSVGAGFTLPNEKSKGLGNSTGWDVSYERTGKKLNTSQDIEDYKKNPFNLQASKLVDVPPIDPTKTAANPEPQDLATPSTRANVGYSGRPHGIFSFPRMGAKLWAFFYGGDVQRPVYFAAAYEPDSIRYAIGSSSESSKLKEKSIEEQANDIINAVPLPSESGESETKWGDTWGGSGGTLEMNSSVSGDSNNSNSIPLYESHVSLRNTAGTGINFYNANMWTIGSADNSSHIHSNEEAISIHNTSGKIKLIGNVEIDGNFTVNSGTNQVDSKETEKHLKAEQAAVDQIAKKTADDIGQGGEEMSCPVCEQKLADDKSDFVTRILRTIQKYSNLLPWDCWNWGVTQFLINFIVIPMLSEISALAVSGGDGCGMCDKGKVKSYSQSIENANKKASETFTQKQNELNESAKHFKAGSNVQTVVGSWGIDAGGNNMNNAICSKELKDDCGCIPTGIKKGTGAKACPLHLIGEKVKTVVHIPPNKTSAGDIFFRSANDIKMIAGSPGIEMKTNGKISITGGFLDLNSMDGPAILTSKNVTNVNGEKVHITGAKGIGLTAPSVGINGNLGVSGNLGVKGSLTVDGALSVKHLKIKTMRSETTSNSSPKSTSSGTTYYTGGAAGINIFDQIKNVLTRDNPLKMLMLTPKGLLTIFQEVYDRILLMIGIHPVPTGFFVGYGSGVVYNFTSNSSKVPDDHSHQFDAPQMTRAADNAAWVNMADDPSSPAPNPAPSQGDDPVGGPHSLAGCGGGGFGFGGGSSASRRRTARNSRYGVPTNSLNYGNITPQGYYNNTIITTTSTNLTGISGDYITVTTDISGNQITTYTNISGNQFIIGDQITTYTNITGNQFTIDDPNNIYTDGNGNQFTINGGLTGTNINIEYDITPNSQKWEYDINGEISPRDLVRFSISEECL